MTDPDEDELLLDPGRPSNHTLVLLAVVFAALAGLVVVRILSAQPHTHLSVRVPLPTSGVRGLPVLALDRTQEPVVDAIVDRGSLVVLRTDSLVRASFSGTVRTKVQLNEDDKLGAEAPAVRLLIDGARNTAWAVSLLERRARVLTFDPATLRPRRVWSNDFIVYDAALLDGRVYVATAEGIAWLDASGHSGHVPHVAGVVSSITADPTRDRLVAVVGRSVVAISARGRIAAVGSLASAATSVRVVAGDIWVAGATGRRGVVVRLDARTLRPQRQVPLQFVPDVVGTGPAALYFVDSDDAAGLWCVNVRTGPPAQISTDSPVSVTATASAAFASSAQGIAPVRSC